jgi:hypothetical protein
MPIDREIVLNLLSGEWTVGCPSDACHCWHG